MRRLVAALTAALLVAGMLALTAGGGAQASPRAAVAAGSITWTDCGEVECGKLKVPRSYANPSAGTVTLALTRRVHTKEPYQGLMLVNPGGPGASGTAYSLLGTAVPGDAGDYYDWVGFDPRGVGSSTPTLRCDSQYFGANRPNFVPTTTALRQYWEIKTAKYAKRCAESSAHAILPFVSTRSTVRDMDAIRAAYQAGDPLNSSVYNKLNFYGLSYGTYLAQIYAVTYPSRVGRFVLDGVVDPGRYWYRSNLAQEIQFDRNLDRFFAWMGAHNSTFKIGSNPKLIRAGFEQLLKNLDKYPAADGRLGPNELTDALLSATYYVFDWDVLGYGYASLVRFGSGWPMFTEYASNQMGEDNGYAMYLATQCIDAPAPSWSQQLKDAARIHRDYPFLAWDNTWYNAPCRSWPSSAGARVKVSGVSGSITAKMLLINETDDAATPYSGALLVRSLFPSSSLIAGVGGTTHAGSLSGVSCVDNRIATFLLNGTTPTRQAGGKADLRCPKVPPPSLSGSRVAGGKGMSAALRDRLMQAQLPKR